MWPIQNQCLWIFWDWGFGAEVGSPTFADLSQKFLSESLLWNAEFIFPEKQL